MYIPFSIFLCGFWHKVGATSSFKCICYPWPRTSLFHLHQNFKNCYRKQQNTGKSLLRKLQSNSLEWQAMPMITQFLSEKQIGYRFHRTVISLASVPIKKTATNIFSRSWWRILKPLVANYICNYNKTNINMGK